MMRSWGSRLVWSFLRPSLSCEGGDTVTGRWKEAYCSWHRRWDCQHQRQAAAVPALELLEGAVGGNCLIELFEARVELRIRRGWRVDAFHL